MKTTALAALTLPAGRVVGNIGDAEAVESKEYGGFTVKKHSAGNVPYDIDNRVYKRFDARNTAFSRMQNDPEYGQEIGEVVRSTTEVIAENQPGLRREDFALSSSSWTVAEAFGTGHGAGEHGIHKGLLQPGPLGLLRSPELYNKPWDRGGLTDQSVTDMIKKTALFYGASLVGITEMDERWIYSDYSDIINQDLRGKIEITDVKEVVLPQGQVTVDTAKEAMYNATAKMNEGEIKALVLRVIEKTPPALRPEQGGSPATMKLMPAKLFAKMFPIVMGTLDYRVVQLFMDDLGLDFKIVPTDLTNDTYKPGYLKDGTLRIPRTMNRVIVMAFEMDYDGMMTSLSGPASAAVGMGYSRMVFTAASVAEFIRALGYNALPCGNNTGLSVPMAIDAGLGELGRNGILITPKYGPRIRLSKVITDMPLLTDRPISFGVTEFCSICGKCAEHCPGEAISKERRVWKGHDRSNNPGVLKWPIKATNCFKVWLQYGMTDCGICIRTCPFNKPDGWLHKITRVLIGAESGSIDKLLLKLDGASGYGKQLDPIEFWKKNNYLHIRS